jgi:molecular chaperone GrpE
MPLAQPGLQPQFNHDPLDKAPVEIARSEEEWSTPTAEPVEDAAGTETDTPEEKEDWHGRALRLQAEMDNYRKRQRRLAQDQVEEERQRLLRAFLRVIDDLERALRSTPCLRTGQAASLCLDGTGHRLGSGTPQAEAVVVPASTDEALRQGVELTHRAALQLLQAEGVERVEAEGQPFDPNWHEAVATVERDGGRTMPNTIVQVMEPGYRLGDQLLRPAKVVVAV